jgi:acyl carrier protein
MTAADLQAVVRDAVALVLEMDPTEVVDTATFAELGADSLVLVSVADVVEAGLAEQYSRELHIDDASLGRMASVGDIVGYALAELAL